MPHLQQRSREERNASPIHVRVSPAERVTITDKAVTSGYSLSEFARQAMLNWSPAVAADGRVDRELNTRQVIPVETPIIVPDDTRIVGVNATVRMTLDIEERACWTDDIP
jgi:hypothetical protein